GRDSNTFGNNVNDLQYRSPLNPERTATLDWDHLTFEVGGKQILKNCYGRLFPGEVCALI
ncbi:unnamed protein product, partial [Amoebophrya sp. A25]